MACKTRKFNGKSFQLIQSGLSSKTEATRWANRWRKMGYNARVTKDGAWWAMWANPERRPGESKRIARQMEKDIRRVCRRQ